MCLVLLFLCARGYAQAQTISGTVSDNENQSLPGVSVTIRGTKIQTSTDGNGKYSLQVADEKAVLVFSFIGFATQEALAGKRTVVNIRLEPDSKALNEV